MCAVAGGTEKKPRRKKIWVHLRSGEIITMRAREFSVDTRGGSISGYSFDGQPLRTWYFWRRRVLYINPGEIAAVEIRGG